MLNIFNHESCKIIDISIWVWLPCVVRFYSVLPMAANHFLFSGQILIINLIRYLSWPSLGEPSTQKKSQMVKKEKSNREKREINTKNPSVHISIWVFPKFEWLKYELDLVYIWVKYWRERGNIWYIYGTDLYCPSHPPFIWLKIIFLRWLKVNVIDWFGCWKFTCLLISQRRPCF